MGSPRTETIPAAGVPRTAESECLETASELRALLEEEAGVLKRFAGTELLYLTSRKESLVTELGWKLESLKKEGGAPLSEPLKGELLEIERLNRSNGLFIRKSLAHWQDFLSIFMPPGYGPRSEGPRPAVAPPRGMAFSREV